MPPITEPIQKHVPAWKKLGLKLKFAREESEDTQLSQNGTFTHKKRKALVGEEAPVGNTPVERSAKKAKKSKLRAEEAGEAVNDIETVHDPRDDIEPGKKIKKSNSRTDDSTEALNGNRKALNQPTNGERPLKKTKSTVGTDVSAVSINGKNGGIHKQESSPPPALMTTPASKGKSVSFTSDTKTKDGDSVKGLYKTWIAKQIAIDPSFNPSTISPALRSVIPSMADSPMLPSSVTSTASSNSEPTIRDNRRPKKKAKTRLPKTSSGRGPSRFDAVLSYLTTHQTAPQTWKFSKPHQNQILKHLYSLDQIPSSYDSALLPYIRGLKGASARSRVRKEALAIREDDEKWLVSEPSETEKIENETVAQCNTRRRGEYEAAITRIKRTLAEKEDEHEERDWENPAEKEERSDRIRKRRRAEIVLWNVGEEEETTEADEVTTPPNTLSDNAGPPVNFKPTQTGPARDPGPAPRVGRGVGMGMGGVEVIDAGGIARDSKGKKIVFGDNGPAQAGDGPSKTDGPGAVNRLAQVNGVAGNGIKPKRKRKRKRRTGMPDDGESSSSSSSSEESE